MEIKLRGKKDFSTKHKQGNDFYFAISNGLATVRTYRSGHTSALQASPSYLSPASCPITPHPCKLSHTKLKYIKTAFQLPILLLHRFMQRQGLLLFCFVPLFT